MMRSIMRIVVAFTFSLHGYQKFFGLFGGIGKGATPPAFSLFWTAGVIETFGGLLLLLGLFARPAAFILAGEMAVAYFRAHQPRALWPIQNGGELAVVYCFVFLYLLAAGPGPLSLDRVIRRKKT
ncbi:MAG TPA: DoxX family protein [Bryobacteraceae bacterium]|nr:DoxX family protein [Bryobacteraceae bacterium]